MGLRDAAPPLAAAALWGGMYVVSKWGFGSVPAVTLAFLRVLVGGGALYVAVRALDSAPSLSARDRRGMVRLGLWVALTLATQFVGTDRTTASEGALLTVLTPVFTLLLGVAMLDESLSARDRRGMVRLGLWVALTLATQFVGTDRTTASEGALLTVLTPVFTLLLGVAMLDESLTPRSVAGMTAAGVGTLFVLAGQYGLAFAGGDALGIVALLVASAAWAAYTVDGARLVRKHGALVAATYSSLAAVPMLAVPAAAELAVTDTTIAVTPSVVGAVAYLGLGSTAAAWFLWYRGVERSTATVVAACFFAQPLVGAALGALLLGEALGPGFAAGGALMGVGVALVSTARAR